MTWRVLAATGDDALDADLATTLDLVGREPFAGAALATARREYPDVAVVAGFLAGEDTTDLVQALIDEGVRVLWLLADRPPPPWATAAAGLQTLVGPVTAEAVRGRLTGSATWPLQVAEAVVSYRGTVSAVAGPAPGGARASDEVPPPAQAPTGAIPPLTACLGALPGCGTSRTAIARARQLADQGTVTLLVDAHAERAHLARYLLGRHLDLLNADDRAGCWRHARSADALRACVVEVAPGLRLLPLAFDPDPAGPLPVVAVAPDLTARWSSSSVRVDLVCRPSYLPQDATAVFEALARGGRAVRVRAMGDGLAETERRVWSQAIGCSVGSGPAAILTGMAAQLIAELAHALRICSPAATSVVVDLGAPRPLVGGVADPRVSWAAQYGRVMVVTRGDALGTEAAERLLTTLRCEAERAGADLDAEVVAADGGQRGAAARRG